MAIYNIGKIEIIKTYVKIYKKEYKGKTAYFGAINQAKFKRKVVPGDVLMLEVEMIKKKGPIGIGKAVATVEGEVAVSAELTFAIG